MWYSESCRAPVWSVSRFSVQAVSDASEARSCRSAPRHPASVALCCDCCGGCYNRGGTSEFSHVDRPTVRDLNVTPNTQTLISCTRDRPSRGKVLFSLGSVCVEAHFPLFYLFYSTRVFRTMTRITVPLGMEVSPFSRVCFMMIRTSSLCACDFKCFSYRTR